MNRKKKLRLYQIIILLIGLTIVSITYLQKNNSDQTKIISDNLKDKIDENLVIMKEVKASFYFKDNTTLNISSDMGEYNNKTLDMKFTKDVSAFYKESKLYAGKAEFLNSQNSLIVSDNVKIFDTRGTMFADKLTFDIKSKTLNITSLKNNVIKSKLNY